MVKLNKRIILHIAIIALLSLIPFMWIQDGFMILGHDAGTPINPTAHFLDRLQTWTHRYALGANQTFATPGLFIHGIEYVLDQIGFSVSTGQGIAFFIYMFCMGLGMYYLARTLFPHKKHLPLFAALIYQFNHFILQAWYIAERTKFTTYIALPVILAFIYTIAHTKRPVFKLSVLTAVLLTIFNGGGFLPLFGSILVIAPLWIAILIATSKNKKDVSKRFALYAILSGIFLFLLNIYWLLPYFSYVSSSYGTVTKAAGGMAGVINWLKSISIYSSYMNAFRLQGIPEWYANPNHPYAQTILYSKLFIFGSFVLPVLAFLPLLIARKSRKIIALIVITCLVSIFFMAGSHAPFGWLYILFIKHIPGFIAFRTAFYKFAPGLWLSYGLLIAYTLDYFVGKISPSRIQKAAFLGICILILAYSYPFVSKSFFNYNIQRTTRVNVPQYVKDYGNDSASGKIIYNRLLTIPPQPRINPVDYTTWEYWSLASVTSLLDQKSYVNRAVDLNNEERLIVNELYDKLDADNPEWIHLASRLGIDGILLREDTQPYTHGGNSIDADFYKAKLTKLGLKPVASYDKWHVYPFFSKKPASDMTLHTSFAVLKDYRHDALFPDLGFDFSAILTDDVLLLHKDQEASVQDLKLADIVLPSCEKCSFPALDIYDEPTDIIIFPGSQFYSIKQWLEKRDEPQNATPKDGLEYKTRQTLRRAFEMRRSIEHEVNRGDRIMGFNYYKSQVDELHTRLDTYLGSMKKNSEDNVLLIKILDNVKLQLKELDSMSGKISDTDEGIPFITLYNALRDVYIKLDTATFKSETIDVKKFMYPISDKGSYEVWIDPYSLLTPSHASNEAELLLKIDSKEVTNNISTKTGWAKFTDVDLNKGTHTLEARMETPNLVPFGELAKFAYLKNQGDNQLLITPGKHEDCQIIPMGTLPQDKYRMSFNTRSEKFESTISVFIDSDKQHFVLLPKLTDTFTSVELGSSHYENDFISNGVAPTNLKICQLFTQKRDNLIISNLTLQRLASPKIALVKRNPAFKQKDAPHNNLQKISNTEYEMNLDPHDDLFVALHQRYDQGWILDNHDKTQTKAQVYAQAWHIPASSQNEKLTVHFASQKEFKNGIMVSLISFALILAGYFFHDVWYKKSKRT